MKIHEYQAKELLARYNVPVPRGGVAETAAEAVAVAQDLGGTVVVKAQIHAGGRGKGGGVKVAHNLAEVQDAAEAILGMQLVTHQTGPAGKKVKKVLVEEGCKIARELYLGMVLDRSVGRVTIMVSTEGGMEIEQVAANTPEKIIKAAIDPAVGFQAYQGRQLAFALGLTGALNKQFVKLVSALYQAYMDSDCSLAEINPLVVTETETLLPLDCKINLDDNALYRHRDLEEWRDIDEEDAAELKAKKSGLSYISLDGDIGCMVNGAGLAMATMDIIKLYGREPANFLDVGGSATEESVTQAFKIILGDARVKAVLVNIFGGIMKCDVIAQGIIAAARSTEIDIPLVVRLQGTNVEAGRRLLANSGLKIVSADHLDDAAQKVVQSIQ